MVFSSITFLFFFLPAAALLYFAIPSIRARNVLLFAASLLFYAWGEPRYVAVMLVSILMNYVFGILIGDSVNQQFAPPHTHTRRQEIC